MQINISGEAEALLKRNAALAGFEDDVEQYVLSLILEDHPKELAGVVGDAKDASSTRREREEANAAIRESFADIEAGRTKPFREASEEFRRKNKLPPRSA